MTNYLCIFRVSSADRKIFYYELPRASLLMGFYFKLTDDKF